jgi:hypothetical protein
MVEITMYLFVPYNVYHRFIWCMSVPFLEVLIHTIKGKLKQDQEEEEKKQVILIYLYLYIKIFIFLLVNK